MTTDALVIAELVIRAPARLLTVNAERRMHHMKRAQIIKTWRQAAMIDARNQHVPRFAWCEIEVNITQARGLLADPGAHYPVVKAIVDGLVDSRIIEDDKGPYVRSITQHPPTRHKTESVLLTLKGELHP